MGLTWYAEYIDFSSLEAIGVNLVTAGIVSRVPVVGKAFRGESSLLAGGLGVSAMASCRFSFEYTCPPVFNIVLVNAESVK